MNPNPARHTSPDWQARHTPRGGNWSSVHPRRPFLFQITQRVEKLLREHGSGDPSLREGSTARAALTGACRNAAKSLSLPFHQVDHFTHRGAPIFVDETKFKRSAVA